MIFSSIWLFRTSSSRYIVFSNFNLLIVLLFALTEARADDYLYKYSISEPEFTVNILPVYNEVGIQKTTLFKGGPLKKLVIFSLSLVSFFLFDVFLL